MTELQSLLLGLTMSYNLFSYQIICLLFVLLLGHSSKNILTCLKAENKKAQDKSLTECVIFLNFTALFCEYQR